MSITVPYLVQRAKICRPLGDFKGEKLSVAVNFDYMGSAEFEWGAIPAAFKLLKENQVALQIDVIPDILNGEAPLRMCHYLGDVDRVDYVEHLRNMRQGKYRLKESIRDYDLTNTYKAGIDFWWDIENNVIWSFDKEFMNRLIDHLNASFKVIS
jgi:hypothetical protein